MCLLTDLTISNYLHRRSMASLPPPRHAIPPNPTDRGLASVVMVVNVRVTVPSGHSPANAVGLPPQAIDLDQCRLEEATTR